jgi:hypothetical protein
MSYPDKESGRRLSASSIRDDMVGGVRNGLLLLLSAVLVVLFIACLNVGVILQAQAWTRRKEIAIRLALGASRKDILRQFLVEGLVLTFLAGCIGVILSIWGVRSLALVLPPNIPRPQEIGLGLSTLVFVFAISIISAAFLGLLPLLQFGASQGKNVLLGGTTLRQLNKRLRARYLRPALVALQVSLAVVLGITGTLMARSFENMADLNFGYRTDHILTVAIRFSRDVCPFSEPEKCLNALKDALDRIKSIKHVYNAAAVSSLPFSGDMTTDGLYFDKGSINASRRRSGLFRYRIVTPEYFSVLRDTSSGWAWFRFL